MATFRYEQRLAIGELRLFQIGEGRDTDPLSITLHTYVVADQNDKYEALSYAWCSTNRTHEISCNGKSLMIQASLHGALWQMREDQDHSLLWADAICIDQSNIDEKTQQVRDMTSIYSAAKKVIVWLGPDTGLARLGLQILEKIDQASTEFNESNEGLNIGENDEIFQRVGLPGINSPDWRAVGDIVKRPWFSRVWILREFMVANNSQMRIGSITTDAEFVICAMAKLVNTRIVHHALTMEEAQPLFSYVNALRIFMETDRDYDGDVPLCCTLFLTRQFQCTDPRDRFFAIMDCTPHRRPNVIDYNSSLSETLFRIADLNVNSFAKRKQRHEALFLGMSCVDSSMVTPDIPSWCPSYVTSQSFNPFLVRPFFEGKIDDSDLQDMRLDEKNVKRLLLKGRCLDFIDQYIEVPIELSVSVHSIARTESSSFSIPSDIYQRNLTVLEDCERLTTQILESSTEEEIERLYLSCISFFVHMSNEVCMEELATIKTSYDAFKQGLILAWRSRVYKDGDNISRMNAICEGQPSLLQTIIDHGGPDRLNHAMREVNNKIQGAAAALQQSLYIAWSGRKFCSTHQRRIGFIPANAETNDVVCFFDGWNVPFVLRPLESESGLEYRIIGNCYIEGMMFGAASEISGKSELLKII